MLKIIISKEHRNAELVRGQWKTKKIIADNSIFKDKVHPKTVYTNQYLLKIIEKCESLGIKVVLIELPGSNSNRNSLPFEYSVEIGNNNQTVYNLNNYEISSTIINSSADWLAPDHLNENGAKKVTNYLLEHVIYRQNNALLIKK